MNILCLLFFLRYLSSKYADDKQSNFAIKLKNFGKGTKTFEESLFWIT